MRRVRAEALVLVNWRGVFYERYLMHPGVTALEGSNGAGKTTVMIAAYVVLLPDLARLRFTNLGETSPLGGDRGIYGRLGEPGRPSYAALDLVLPDRTRLVAGVHLERRAEPSVELVPFLITGLDPGVSLQEVFLDRGEVDEVPERPRLKELAALAGGVLKTFSSSKDYFAALFDLGVTPLRLAREEERTKFSEMLRTSMVGGISRALTGGLRDFLLKEETGLADTLQRMRANLEACHRTRLQVKEARELEGEIHGVYEAGQQMFAAGLLASRERARETRERLEEARERLERAVAEREVLAGRHAEAAARAEEARGRRAGAEEEVETARGRAEVLRRANRLHRKVLDLEAEGRRLAEAVAEARRDWERAEEARGAETRRHGEALRCLEVASRGLGDFQAGFQELARRALAHEEVRDRLASARSRLAGEPREVSSLGSVRSEVEARLGALDGDISRLEREMATAAARRNEFDAVLGALRRLAEGPLEPGLEFARGREVLGVLRRLEERAARLPDLEAEREAARSRSADQARVRREAGRFSLARCSEVAGALEQAEARGSALVEERGRLALEEATQARRVGEAEEQARGLEERRGRWLDLAEEAGRLSRRWDRPLGRRAEAEDLLAFLQEARDEARTEQGSLERRLGEVEAELNALRHGGRFPEDLLAARDALDAELLAGRYDDVTLEEAAMLQARLGPLHEALLVEDCEAAARALAAGGAAPGTVWLVDDTSRLDLEALEVWEGSVVVPGESAWRVSRLPERPLLGRRARDRRVQELGEERDRLRREAEALRAELRALGEGLQDLQAMLPEVDLLEAGDPGPRLEEARAEAERARHAAREAAAAREALEEQGRALARRREDLRRLLPEAWLLDEPSLEERAAALDAEVEEVRRGQRRLERLAPERERLEAGLEALRVAPPGPEALEAMASEAARVREERDLLAGALRDLRYVEENREALGWEEAARSLAEQRALAPALEEQVERAKEAVARATTAREAAEARARDREAAHTQVAARLAGVDESLERHRTELEELGCEDPSDGALARVEARLAAAVGTLEVRRREAEDLGHEAVRLQERAEAQGRAVAEREAEAAQEEAAWRPSQERWERLEAVAGEQGVLAPALTARVVEALGGRASVALFQEARSSGRLLADRLARAKDAAEAVPVVQRAVEDTSDQLRSDAYLEAWLVVRDWLRRRIPPSIAEVDEPLEALGRLREHLARLEDRLAGQERDLRGRSSDVARNIETQIRKARRQVVKLNHDLRQVRFGSISSVQIEVRNEPKMWQVLEALKEPEAQQLLFEAETPIEEALELLFRRYGGGRTGGDRLLDYRSYVDLAVQVRREAGPGWEEANPTRMSTGEAIGVGAAVMIVVLTAWERDANLFRTQRSSGTLRLLFLDEANRLSQDSLAVMFDLCRNLDLQLLIAAPEVARAEGNTTYHLVRRVDERGREEVLVTGRRAVAGSPA